MKVSYSPYKLKPKNFQATHLSTEGTLLCFETSESVSYSLYHPIKSLGDMSLSVFLKKFKDIVFNSGSMKRIYDLSLNETEHKPIKVSSYKTCRSFSDARETSSKVVKVKINSIQEVLEGLIESKNKFFILDANGSLSLKDIKLLKDKEIISRIKYLEDPLKEEDLMLDLPVASDFIDYKNYDYKVVKPTGFCHSIMNRLNKPIVVTSYLDHPLGQLISAKYAVDSACTEECGLMTHTIFEKNAYSELFEESNDFQFNDYKALFGLLKKEKWIEI